MAKTSKKAVKSVKKVAKKVAKVVTTHKKGKLGTACGLSNETSKTSPQWQRVTCKNCLRTNK